MKVSTESLSIATYGAGRMGSGIVICFALPAWQIALIDSKSRSDRHAYKEGIEVEIAETLALLVDFGFLPAGSETVMSEHIALFS